MRGFGPVPLTDDHGKDEGLEGLGVTGESLEEVNREIRDLETEGYRIGIPPKLKSGYWTAVMVRERDPIADEERKRKDAEFFKRISDGGPHRFKWEDL